MTHPSGILTLKDMAGTKRARKEIGKVLPAHSLMEPSDVIAIPLKDGEWAYARILESAQMAILDLISEKLETIEGVKGRKAVLFLPFCEPYDVSPWFYVGKWEFENEDEKSGPPLYIRDVIDPKQLRTLKGHEMIRNCSEEDIQGLEPATLLYPANIESRIQDIKGGLRGFRRWCLNAAA